MWPNLANAREKRSRFEGILGVKVGQDLVRGLPKDQDTQHTGREKSKQHRDNLGYHSPSGSNIAHIPKCRTDTALRSTEHPLDAA